MCYRYRCNFLGVFVVSLISRHVGLSRVRGCESKSRIDVSHSVCMFWQGCSGPRWCELLSRTVTFQIGWESYWCNKLTTCQFQMVLVVWHVMAHYLDPSRNCLHEPVEYSQLCGVVLGVVNVLPAGICQVGKKITMQAVQSTAQWYDRSFFVSHFAGPVFVHAGHCDTKTVLEWSWPSYELWSSYIYISFQKVQSCSSWCHGSSWLAEVGMR